MFFENGSVGSGGVTGGVKNYIRAKGYESCRLGHTFQDSCLLPWSIESRGVDANLLRH
jgi:hypothetical protein